MDMGSILFALALMAGVGIYLAYPLLDRSGSWVSEVERERSELFSARDRILAALHELDMDYSMGKIFDEDYSSQRDALRSRGAEILKEIDALGLTEVPAVELDDVIEAQVSRLRQEPSTPTSHHCTNCGNKVTLGDSFCARCGTAIEGGTGS